MRERGRLQLATSSCLGVSQGRTERVEKVAIFGKKRNMVAVADGAGGGATALTLT